MRHAAICIALFALIACGGGQDDYVDRMATEHAEDAPTANPMSAGEPASGINGQEVAYASIDGQAITGYLASPTGVDGPRPGILVIHEWWGLNDNIRAMADKLAAEGYHALAVDLYGGRTAESADRARELMSAAMEEAARAEQNLTSAHTYLRDELGAATTGVLGWCFGGTWSLRTALMLGEDLDAAVMYYGQVVTDRDRLAALEAPLLGLFGEEDGGIPIEGVRQFRSILADLSPNSEVVIYPGSGHAFANPSGRNYQAEAAEDSWQRTVAFFARHLGQ